ncbi:phosphoribosylaminoimidazole-succinocarboxamide synthase [Spirochaeta thermophila DSM 6578]|uniref:Phosphoribosylaminoimidazole-succinocarboxamide synthase n=1 Tax=Winmispira thermophila (strain ATCC 700085 / DSM 6578 / Z-1203) TaxID=869211 RepID=G0GF53_WINT7|nr:phosphoribosylaminoimidazolesuccinocarboxamide synthase [Spirochaeta thermophila]AEJ60752.1 phosphoribosylaminoimidazole-succinocarboxamide synthase [Spirochaeta thermophila DSM 6578]
MGSVKDLEVVKAPSDREPGEGRFRFSDRYSVFDWGKMPDDIAHKGAAICIATAYFFERLAEEGIPSHYLGVVEDGRVVRLSEARGPVRELACRLFRVVRPSRRNGEYDYGIFAGLSGNFLIPLEVIYRNSLPPGSSLFRRLASGALTHEDLGLAGPPEPGMRLDPPMLDVSTKLEETDRYLSWEEAQRIAGLSEEEVAALKERTRFLDRLITEETRRLGLDHEDGKVEYAFDEGRRLVLVDALGTLDECRFTYRGIPVSKEVARIFYRRTEWYRRVEEAKKEDRVHWKERVGMEPPPLPREFAQAISEMYMAYANELTGREWFKVRPLSEVLRVIREFVG